MVTSTQKSEHAGNSESSIDTSSNPDSPMLGEVRKGRRTIPEHHRKRVMRMLQIQKGPIRWQEFKNAGVDDHALREMVKEGSVIYPATGIFAAPGDYDPLRFAFSVLRAHGTEFFICLKTAAQYHGLLPVDDPYIWLVMPVNRNTFNEVTGFRPVPVRWKSMQLPEEPVMLDDVDRASIGWHPDMSQLEQTERFVGVIREWGYGTQFKVTNPARTVCDLLAFKERPIGREGLNGLSIPAEVAFEALRNFCQLFDIAEAKEMAYRIGYGDEIVDQLRMGGYLSGPQR